MDKLYIHKAKKIVESAFWSLKYLQKMCRKSWQWVHWQSCQRVFGEWGKGKRGTSHWSTLFQFSPGKPDFHQILDRFAAFCSENYIFSLQVNDFKAGALISQLPTMSQLKHLKGRFEGTFWTIASKPADIAVPKVTVWCKLHLFSFQPIFRKMAPESAFTKWSENKLFQPRPLFIRPTSFLPITWVGLLRADIPQTGNNFCFSKLSVPLSNFIWALIRNSLLWKIMEIGVCIQVTSKLHIHCDCGLRLCPTALVCECTQRKADCESWWKLLAASESADTPHWSPDTRNVKGERGHPRFLASKLDATYFHTYLLWLHL